MESLSLDNIESNPVLERRATYNLRTPVLCCVLLGGGLSHEDRPKLESEILSGLWLPLLSFRVSHADRDRSDELPSSRTPTNLHPLGGTLPMEIWLNILSQFLMPRVHEITFSESSRRWAIGSEVDRIPGALFVDQTARAETLKTHQSAFRDLFEKPILFNSQTDILLFDEKASKTVPTATNIGIFGASFNVRFIAFRYDPDLGPSLDDRDPQVTAMLRFMRVFGTIEKIFIISQVQRPKDPEWEARLKGCFQLKYHHVAAMWESMEQAGIVITSKWDLPEIVIVKRENELLATSGTTRS